MHGKVHASTLDGASDKRYRLRKAGIAGSTVPVGHGNHRRLEPCDETRLYTIARIRTAFGVKKIPNDELAFWLAASGDAEMPPELIKKAITRSTRRFVGRFMGLLAKRIGGPLRLEDPEQAIITKISKSIVDAIKRASCHSGGTAANALGVSLDLLLMQILRPTTKAGASKAIAAFLTLLGFRDEQIAEFTPSVWNDLQDIATFFVKGDGNSLIAATNKSAMTGHDARRLVQDAHVIFGMLSRAFPWFHDLELERTLVPMIAGMFLHLEKNPNTVALRTRIDLEGQAALQESVDGLLGLRNALEQRFAMAALFAPLFARTGTLRRVWPLVFT